MRFELPDNAAGRILGSIVGGIRLAPPPARAKTFGKPFHPVINRHTGEPHEHKREIARRARQAAR
ncbi:hypothetical protein [Sphingobium sp. HDIP04]|uniref:hypothetical protein n=1 Tax=Sphingobium sp. HDIP04 TaxID=428994 RepID=UPI000387854E|nr:hypothetical protein [Sphingobium sp. HDIP04]EQA97302.1 hypothetical protein L286_23545 [Sphingobium sp. HDIP04]